MDEGDFASEGQPRSVVFRGGLGGLDVFTVSEMDHVFSWRARIIRVVDGDTVDVELDTGFRTVRTERLRLAGINCPEMHGATLLEGRRAKAFTEQWVWAEEGKWPFEVVTGKADSFGRWVARVSNQAGGCLNDELLTSQNAVPFMGSTVVS